MAETADYEPGVWRGFDFKDARKTYDAHAGRSYAEATTSGKTATDVIVPMLETMSPSPLIINCDVTGSMGEWPATIFSKLPYLDIEGKQYLGPDMEIAFGATGDAFMGDSYPLQVQPFGKGTVLKKHLKALIIEGGGGGDTCESYELSALYYCRNCQTPNAIKPILIFIGDEGIHDYVERGHGTSALIHMTEPRIDSKDIFAELSRKFATYVVRKHYSQGGEQRIQNQWIDFLGEDHVVMLPSADRVVDVIFGILAKETGKIDYFRQELEGRQRPEQVQTVYTSLRTVHKGMLTSTGKSRMYLPTDAKAKKSKHLLTK